MAVLLTRYIHGDRQTANSLHVMTLTHLPHPRSLTSSSPTVKLSGKHPCQDTSTHILKASPMVKKQGPRPQHRRRVTTRPPLYSTQVHLSRHEHPHPQHKHPCHNISTPILNIDPHPPSMVCVSQVTSRFTQTHPNSTNEADRLTHKCIITQIH